STRRHTTSGPASGVPATAGRTTGPSAATRWTARAVPVAYAWSEVATTSRTVWPASIRRVTAGSRTVTGAARDRSAGSPDSRTGATRPAGRVATPSGSTS